MTDRMDRALRSLLALMMSIALLPNMAHAEHAASSPEQTSVVDSDGLLVTVAETVHQPMGLDYAAQGTIDQIEELDLRVDEQFRTASGALVLTVESDESTISDKTAEALAEIPNVAAVQPNYIYHSIDPLYVGDERGADAPAPLSRANVSDPFALNSASGSLYNQYWIYNARLIDSWDEARCDNNVTIAILDRSMNPWHPDLRENILCNFAWDAVKGRPLDFGAADFTVSHGHGTHVAGIAGARTDNSLGIAGASYNANILPVLAIDDEGNSSSKSLVRAYDYLMELQSAAPSLNLRAINMSLGAYGHAANDELLHQAIMRARNEFNILTVCAGGNGSPAGEPYTSPLYPSDFAESISVTALEPDGSNIYWSDYNANKDISAPGRDICSTSGLSNGFLKLSGTSMAAPMVSGAIALMFASVPDATADEVESALFATAKPIRDPLNDRTGTSGSHGSLDCASALSFLKENHTKRFYDVSADDWFYDAVQFACDKKIMTGYGDNAVLFGPYDNLTRAQAAEILYRHLQGSDTAPTASFTDVAQNEWYAKAINWVTERGYMEGYRGTRLFGVDDPLSREQLCCILSRASGEDPSQASSAPFNSLLGADLVSPWARQATIWAVDRGIIHGVGGYDLDPSGTVSRSQMAQVMMNATSQGSI